MNVIVANKYQTLLGSSDIEVIKTSYGVFNVNEIIGLYKNFFFNKLIIDVTAIEGYQNPDNIQQLSMNFDMSKVILLLDDTVEVNSPQYLSKLVSMGIYNFTTKVDTVKFLIDNPNQYSNVARYQNVTQAVVNEFNDTKVQVGATINSLGKRIIGIKNITEHAGATTLTYMMHKTLQRDYQVESYEIGKHDFTFFNNEKMVGANAINILELVSNSSAEVILVDLNTERGDFCTEVIYLIEPGIVKLNKLIKFNPYIFSDLEDKKVVLNFSTLNATDVKDFEKESGSKIFTTIPYVDDKKDNNKEINDFVISLGFTRATSGGKSSLFGIF